MDHFVIVVFASLSLISWVWMASLRSCSTRRHIFSALHFQFSSFYVKNPQFHPNHSPQYAAADKSCISFSSCPSAQRLEL